MAMMLITMMSMSMMMMTLIPTPIMMMMSLMSILREDWLIVMKKWPDRKNATVRSCESCLIHRTFRVGVVSKQVKNYLKWPIFLMKVGYDDVVDCKYVESREWWSLINIIRDRHQRCIHFCFDHNRHHCDWHDSYFPLNCHQLSCCNVILCNVFQCRVIL